MKRRKFFFTYYSFFFFAVMFLYGSPLFCQNIGFEQGNFNGWSGYTWVLRTVTDGPINTPKVPGIVSGRHTIMTDKNAYDLYTDMKLKLIPPGYNYSARLGDDVNGNLMESLSYTIKVDASNALLVYKFAVVLQDPQEKNHKKSEEPRFKVTLFNQFGDTIRDCANYDVYASDARISGFQSYIKKGFGTLVWRDWTTVAADLSAYIGQTVTIEFMAADCTRDAHFGYAYLVAGCQPRNITVGFCKGDLSATLNAPPGFEAYSWRDDGGIEVGTKQIYTKNNPIESAPYTCNMTSATGCTVTLNAKTERYVPKADFSSVADCSDNSVTFTNLTITTKGNLSYLWDFGDGITSIETNPKHTFATPGLHTVSLKVTNPPSTCTDSLQKEIESFSPKLVEVKGFRLYCITKTTTLKGFGADHYEWGQGKSIFSQSDSIVIGDPGAKIWMIGYSSTNCVSDTVNVIVEEEPKWTLKVDGENLFCYNDSVKIVASGASTYKWSTGQTTDFIYIKKPGNYSVMGFSPLRCEQSMSVDIAEVALPESNFIMLNPTVDARRSVIRCFVVGPKPDVEYSWDMGDESFETGTTIQHRYSGFLNADLQYKVTLKATNATGCSTETVKLVEIVPFFPNIFTPNGDGINDLLMQGIEILIYDRNGMLLYSGNIGWDGKYKGKDVDCDTYFYTASYTDRSHQPQTQKGSVTLIR